MTSLVRALTVALSVALPVAVLADPPGDPKAVKKDESGKYFDAKGNPTFNIGPDGTVDWYTYLGQKRYGFCEVCHGGGGEGGSFAPALKNSVKNFDYAEFYGIVVGGRQNMKAGVPSVMPAFADNKNVMCVLDYIYVYLRARGEGLLTTSTKKFEPRTPKEQETVDACLGAG